jgi:hypothetical protein
MAKQSKKYCEILAAVLFLRPTRGLSPKKLV